MGFHQRPCAAQRATSTTCFAAGTGGREVHWPDSGVSLAIEADMDYYILYAPVDRDFFCFEPVDHAINAHNLPGGAARNGLTVLAPGQTLEPPRELSRARRLPT